MFSIVPFPQPVYHISYSDWARGGGESGTKSLVESQINSPVLDRHLDLNITAHQLDTHTSSLSDNSSETEETDLTPPQADTSTPPTPLADPETRVIDSAVSSLLPPLTLSASPNQQQKDDKPPPTRTGSRSSFEEIDTLVTSSLILPERIDHFPTTSSLDSGVYSSLPSSEASVTGTMANVGGVAVQSSPLSPRNRKLPKVADSGRGRCPKCKKLVYFGKSLHPFYYCVMSIIGLARIPKFLIGNVMLRWLQYAIFETHVSLVLAKILQTPILICRKVKLDFSRSIEVNRELALQFF